MLLIATLANTKLCKNPEKLLKPWQMGTHLRVLSESYPKNTNMTGFRWFSTIFESLFFGRKYIQHENGWVGVHEEEVLLLQDWFPTSKSGTDKDEWSLSS